MSITELIKRWKKTNPKVEIPAWMLLRKQQEEKEYLRQRQAELRKEK